MALRWMFAALHLLALGLSTGLTRVLSSLMVIAAAGMARGLGMT